MILTITERFTASSCLQEEGDIIFLRVKKDLVNKLSLSEEEIKEYDLKVENGLAKWRIDLPQEKEITLTEGEIAIITKELKKLNDKRSLTQNHVSLYEKFVEKKKEEIEDESPPPDYALEDQEAEK